MSDKLTRIVMERRFASLALDPSARRRKRRQVVIDRAGETGDQQSRPSEPSSGGEPEAGSGSGS